ncbi:hypothetical protein GCM10028777_15750 [Angustibacter speluncae]
MTTPIATRHDPADVRRAYRVLEPLHSFVYFSAESERELLATGLRPGRMPYLAQRSAPLGAVGAGVVVATFYNFAPAAVARALPRAWTLASPAEVLDARWRAVVAALGRLLDGAGPAEVDVLADLAGRAAAACEPEGRPLAAAHAEVEVPDHPLARFWQAVTVLREHRGDGHVAALVQRGVTGLDALVSHTAGGRGFAPAFAAASRGWTPEQWQEAADGLRARGLLDPDGRLTDAGRALREELEVATDAASARPLGVLDADGLARLTALGRSLSGRAVAAGAYPADGVMATRPA